MSDQPSKKPVPRPNPETAPFWEGCSKGELRLQHCLDCEHVQYPARRLCSACFSQKVEWRVASGRGIVRSWSTVLMPGAPGFREEVPFLSVLVQLDEGPTMLSVLRQCTDAEVDFDLPVQVIFEQRSENIHVPYFKPAE